MGKWKNVAFDELIVDETRKGTKIPQGEYLPSGKYPIIDQGKKLISGYWDRKDGLYHDVPAIVFGTAVPRK